jgi:N-methylhydantoinase A/oxoprolinase/acetone carboxylase beta subunit
MRAGRRPLQIGVDIGGTFTDIVALDADGRLTLTKVPSTPKDLLDGIGAAVRRILALAGAAPGSVERFIHGTTVATNAVLEQKGAVTAILTTEGFEDVLEVGRQKRSRMYDLEMDVETPTFLAPRRRRIGVRERLDARGAVLVPLDADQVRAEVAALRAQGVGAVAVRSAGRWRRSSACRSHARWIRPFASTSACASPHSTPTSAPW